LHSAVSAFAGAAIFLYRCFWGRIKKGECVMQKNIKKPQINSVFITPHAYQRYRDRVNNEASKNEISKTIKEVIKFGKVIYTKHDGSHKEFVLKYNGLEVLADIQNSQATVVTCYGYSDYAKWYRRQEYFARRSYCS
jgi:hypothetical protein